MDMILHTTNGKFKMRRNGRMLLGIMDADNEEEEFVRVTPFDKKAIEYEKQHLRH